MNERSVDQYEILRELGRGGTSVVYLVKDKADRRNYAMKVLRNDDGKQELSEKKADHLSAEAEVLKALCIDEPGNVSLHPGIPAYIECVCDGKGEFAGFVMEYVEGRSLQKILEDGRAYTVREAVEAGLQLCGIMEQLHGQDSPMIFRDLKPANILVRPDGQFVLVDYGAVRKLRKSAGSDTMQLGTDGYAAPEQYGGWEQSDERTDIYGIGAVLHHMITGRPPLDTGLRPLREILGAEGESRQLDEMAKILLRCCMTAPSMRYSSCKELEKALRSVIRLRTRSRSRERGWKWFVLLVNTAAVCLGLAIVLAASRKRGKRQTLKKRRRLTEGQRHSDRRIRKHISAFCGSWRQTV